MVFFVIYAVFFTLGFQKLAEINYTTLKLEGFSTCISLILPIVCLVFVGLRLIYASEALSRYLLLKRSPAEGNTNAEGLAEVESTAVSHTESRLGISKRIEIAKSSLKLNFKAARVLLHYLALLLQATLFYLACSALNESMNSPAILPELNATIILILLLFLINTVWLLIMLIGAWKFLKKLAENHGPRPRIWFFNNLIWGTCAAIVYFFCAETGIVAFFSILLINSFIDLTVTADSYMPQSGDPQE